MALKIPFSITLLLAGVLLLASCGKTSPNSDEAKARASQAAKELMAVEPTDTFAMQRCILNAVAVRSEYLIKGDSIAAYDFDCAFQEAIVKQAPSLAASLFKSKPQPSAH